MKNFLRFSSTIFFFFMVCLQVGNSQCVELGTTIGELSPVLKSPIGFCPGIAEIGDVCDCPPGFVVTGYEGSEGNVYGPQVLSQFRLRCRELNSDGTLGASVSVTCNNGTAVGNTADGPVDAAAGEALVGFEIRIGCATDAVMGESISIADIEAGVTYSTATTNAMSNIGGTGGAPQPVMYVPTGNVIIGMQTYVEPLNQPAGAQGITAGVAWRYAPIVSCPTMCSIDAITVGNISACNDNGTSDPADDTFTADVTVDFTNPPATGNLSFGGSGAGSVVVGSLDSPTSHTFTGVTMSANGSTINITANFTANTGCSLINGNAGTAPSSCSSTPPPSTCSINSISVANISACDDNGTPSIVGDDTFTADVTITYNDPPNSGSLSLGGDGSAIVTVGSLNGPTSHTFNGVTMTADGTAISLTANFNAAPGCNAANANAGTAPANCSPLPPTIPTMSEWGLILFSLIIFTLSVVFGTQQQRAMAMNGTAGSVSSKWKLPFDRARFMQVLPIVYLGAAVVFGTAIAFFGYELTNADIPGSLLSGLVVAYLIQFVLGSKKQ